MHVPDQPTRRLVVAGGLTAVVGAGLTACSAASNDTGRTAAPNPLQPVATDPDVALARRARRDEADLYDLVVSTRKRHRSLRAPLRRLEKSHLDHVGRLTAGTSLSLVHRRRRVAKDAGRALSDLASAERALARKHVASALDAESGALARVIASMSAAAAQQGSVLEQVR